MTVSLTVSASNGVTTSLVLANPVVNSAAPPVFRAVASIGYASRTNTTVNKPAGTVNGDVMIAEVFVGRNSSAPALTVPTGWTTIGTPSSVTDTSGFVGVCHKFWKRANNEGASYTFTHSAASTEALIASYSGCVATGSPIGAISSGTAATGAVVQGTSTTAPSITTTAANSRILFWQHGWDVGASTPPTGMTERFEGLIYLADYSVAAPGATGAKTGNATYAPWAAGLIELKAGEPAPLQAPVVSAASFSVTAGAGTVGTMSATNSPTSWAITGGNSAGYFSINGAGVISASAALVAGSYSLTVQASNAAGSGSSTASITVSVATVSSGWPGQSGNLVGYAATPAVMPTFTAPTTWPAGAVWPGAYPGSLQGNTTVQSGTPSAPRVYAFRDLDGSGFGDLHDVVFVGCRFQMTSDWPPAIQLGGPNCRNVSFFYCSVVPYISAAAQPPNGGGYTTWPTGGWCSNAAPDNQYQISSTAGCFTGFELWFHPTVQAPVGLIQIDHCDIWGMGCAIAFGLDLPGGGYFTDNWMHDFPASQPAGWHTNGLAQSNNGGVVGVLNPMVIRHNVIAGWGGSNALAFQNTNNSQFKNIVIDNNFVTGWGGIPIRLGTGNGITQAQYDSWVQNIQFTNNTLSTGTRPQFAWLYGYETMVFKGNTNANGNRWFGNKLQVEPGSTPVAGTWSPTDNGKYLLPNGGFSTTDFS